jgi:hypothetical protein
VGVGEIGTISLDADDFFHRVRLTPLLCMGGRCQSPHLSAGAEIIDGNDD